ncbi:MAG: hypothetical protein U1F77_17770 [Kiritimatiellia bacterium]
MAKPDKAYQEFYCRQHRILGAFLAVHCWHNLYDAVIVGRETLAHIHQLRHFTEKHLSWLQNDIRPYFCHSEKLYYYKGSKKFAAVALSRVPIPPTFGHKAMHDVPRAKFWRGQKFKVAALAELVTCVETFTEETAASFLTLAGVGLSFPKPLPHKPGK